jgi:hypothetical protein
MYRKSFGPESVFQRYMKTRKVDPVVRMGMTEHDTTERRKFDMSLKVGQTTGSEVDDDRR